MTQFYYSGQYFLKRAGRTSPNAFAQIKNVMPAPEAVMVSGRAAAGWSLPTWRQVAQSRQERLKKDMLAAAEELQTEETELSEKYRKKS